MLTAGENALEIAYREDVPVKSESFGMSFWVDKNTAATVRGYAEKLGLNYSELYRGIFLANLPTDEEIENYFKKYGIKKR